VLRPALSAAQGALARHQHHVQHINNMSYISMPSGENAAGHFTCTSVTSPKTTSYAGCIGELLCTCPQALRDVCKHLEAAAGRTPFTHDMRQHAAAALVNNISAATNQDRNILNCRHVTMTITMMHYRHHHCLD
jgi:hypothetical protein